jgi:hypothetical protein
LAIAVRFAVGGGIRRGTHSCACGRRGNRTRRRWTSGCGKHDVHTCWGIEDAMVSRVPGWMEVAALKKRGAVNEMGRVFTYRLQRVCDLL